MAKLLEFIREWIDIRRESKSYCKSCETLKEQLATANYEKKQLLDKFVLASAPPIEIPANTAQPIIPKTIPWKLKREMLEAEDRAKAAAIRREEEEKREAEIRFAANKAGQSGGVEITVEELERELGVQ